MGVLVLLRHGQASLGTDDYDNLSELGREQARRAGQRLAAADLHIERVVRGTLRRQRDTAELAIAEMGLNPDSIGVDAHLDEYDHDAVLAAHRDDISFADAPNNGPELQSAIDAAIQAWMVDGTETHTEFVSRVLAGLDDLTAAPGNTLAVTSGGVIGVMCAHLLGLDPQRWPDFARVGANAAITKVVAGRSGRNLLTFNDHAHLEADRALITYR